MTVTVDGQRYPVEILEYARNGGCVCDLCPRPTWQCGTCSVPQHIETLLSGRIQKVGEYDTDDAQAK